MILSWERMNSSKLTRARASLDAVLQTGTLDLATLSVMSRELRGLVR
jgi:glutamate dehydrogenase